MINFASKSIYLLLKMTFFSTNKSLSGLRRFVIFSVLFFTSFVFAIEASAQRTARGQYFLDVNSGFSLLHDPSLGFGVSAGQYLLTSRWEAGVDMQIKRNYGFKNGVQNYYPMFAHASYMFRLCSDRTRAINLYAGLGALLGAEVLGPEPVDPLFGYGNAGGSGVDVDFGQIEDAKNADPTIAFIYGFQPKFEAELFILKRVALTASLRMPFVFGSEYGFFNLTGNAGLRFNF